MLKKILSLSPLMILMVTVSVTSVQASTGLTEGWAEVITEDSAKVYDVVDQMPEIEGGIGEIYKYIEYPQAAVTRRIEGRVFIKFVVDENGRVRNPEIVKDIGSGCGDAAIEGIKKVKFKPGKLQGQAVKVNYTLPVNFQIQK